MSLNAKLNNMPDGVHGELKPYKDKLFMKWFVATKFPVHQIQQYYQGWCAAREALSAEKLSFDKEVPLCDTDSNGGTDGYF